MSVPSLREPIKKTGARPTSCRFSSLSDAVLHFQGVFPPQLSSLKILSQAAKARLTDT